MRKIIKHTEYSMGDFLPRSNGRHSNFLETLFIREEKSAHVHLQRVCLYFFAIIFLRSSTFSNAYFEWKFLLDNLLCPELRQVLAASNLGENHGRIDEYIDIPWKIRRHRMRRCLEERSWCSEGEGGWKKNCDDTIQIHSDSNHIIWNDQWNYFLRGCFFLMEGILCFLEKSKVEQLYALESSSSSSSTEASPPCGTSLGSLITDIVQLKLIIGSF